MNAVTSALDALPPMLALVAVLVSSLVAAVVVERVVVRLLRRLGRSTENALDDIVFEELRLPLVVSAALAGVFLLTGDGGVLDALAVDAATRDALFSRPALSVLVVVWAWALNAIVNRAVDAVQDAGPRFDFAPVFSNVWTLIVIVAAAAAILSIWRIDVTPLLAGAGIAGITIGFAAKDTVANFFGGIALYFDDTYKIGDFVVLDSGEKGTVVKVGVRSTTLQTRDEVLVTVPNAVLNAAKIVNESAPGSRKRIRVPIGVAYGTDIDAFEAAVVGVAEAESLVLDSPKPRMRFRAFGDSALEYELLCWVRSPVRGSKATHELNRGIYGRLTDLGIEIPFSKLDVTLVNGAADAAAGATGQPSLGDD
ncbi:mechanosensitive ion channel family protein [Halolamina sp. CBA1230]|uniref:mechanosensitive ion channel family protein n=1 Tax=Halolamina sp. CBA1230 TaxID=1853690 RepID=UPI0009A1F8E6|nr:mechanosensitive ion channel family protein [Halolamina sp. CBA1230]QKY19606.1 mechanosensitive ion channel family protein [Halolamina sp. CBA1230]